MTNQFRSGTTSIEVDRVGSVGVARRTVPVRTLGAGYVVALVAPIVALAIFRSTATSPHAATATIIANAGARPLPLWLQLLIVALSLLAPIGVIGLARIAIPQSPWIGIVGAALGLLGWGTFPVWIGQDTLTGLMGQMGGGAQLVDLWDRFNGSPTLNAYLAIFVIGHLFGPLLLMIALARGRVVGWWSPALIAVSIPLHVATFVTGLVWPDPVAYGMLIVALLPAVWAILTDSSVATPTPDDRKGDAHAGARALYLEPAAETAPTTKR